MSAEEEADAILEAAAAGRGALDELLARRVAGEPLAWVVGWAPFDGLRVRVDRDVFVPRPHSEMLAHRAADLAPERGTVVDICTGSGAIAMAISARRPAARVVATEVDPAAVACARANGVDVLEGDLFSPLPVRLRGKVDVVTGVLPYVPTDAMHLLPRDVVAHEPRRALDGGPGGVAVIDAVLRRVGVWLRPGGSVLVEIGGDQRHEAAVVAGDAGLTRMTIHRDDDGRDLVFEARRPDGMTGST